MPSPKPPLLPLLTLALSFFACDRGVTLPAGLAWDDAPPLGYIGQQRLAITNNGSDTLAMVTEDSLDTPRLLGMVHVGNNPIELEGPHHLARSPDGRFIYFNLSNYVVNGGSGPHGAHGTGTVPGYLVKLDARTGQQVAEVLVDRSPGDVIVSPDGHLVFVSHYDLARLQTQLAKGAPEASGYSSVFIINADTLEVLAQPSVCPTAHGMGLSPDAGKLYVTCSQSDELAILDIRSPGQPQITKLKVGPTPGPIGNPAYAPYALSVHPDGTVWVSDNQSGDVRAYDPTTGQMDPQRVVKTGGIAMFSDFTTDGKYLLVPHQGDDRVTGIELATLNTTTLALPQAHCLNAHALHVLPGAPAGAVVVCEGDHVVKPGSVVFLDTPPALAGWSVHGSLDLGLFPDGIVSLPALP